MTGKEQIKSYLQEAEIYCNQGLYKQSRQKYLKVRDIIEKHDNLSGNLPLKKYVNEKIQMVDIALDEIEKEPDTPELSEDVQGLISDLFSFSGNKDMAAIEGAIALAKFGQYEKALREFERLIDMGTYPLVAAKNMLRCKISFSSPEQAVAQFKKWASGNTFTKMELRHLEDFLGNLLRKEGMDTEISDSHDSLQQDAEGEIESDEFLEICSVEAFLDQDQNKDKKVNLDVTCQIGNNICCIVSPDKKDIIEALKPGIRLSRVQCYSQESVLNTGALISQRTKITSGPRKGFFSFDLTLEGV